MPSYLPFSLLLALAGCSIHSPADSNNKHLQAAWSVAVLRTPSLAKLSESLESAQPVMGAEDVQDCNATFVADPFLNHVGARWQLFFEVFDRDQNKGSIALAESLDGFHWDYRRVVLDEPFHLSYPQVFSHGGSQFMIPESRQGGGVRLYQADEYPTRWRFVKLLIPGDYADPSIVFFQGEWWLFAVEGAYNLVAFHSASLLGPWTPHEKNPLYSLRKDIARPGGRMLMHDGK